MSKDSGSSSPGGDRSNILDRLEGIAATSAATIIALHGTSFAAASQVAQPQRTVIPDAPMLDGPTLAAAGVTLATVGAYRLMRARKRTPPPDGSNKS